MHIYIYRVIHKSLRDFRPLRYSSRDGHAEREHVNRGRDTPSFCRTLQVLSMCTLGDAADVNPVIKFLWHAHNYLYNYMFVLKSNAVYVKAEHYLGTMIFRKH
jgi:hypothetical protein